MYQSDIDGQVVVIGDTHGDYDRVKNLLGYLAKEKIIDNRWVVFLGDYVDQGKDTKELISLLLAFKQYHSNTTFLCGNHDLNLTKALNIVNSPHHEFYKQRIPQRNKTVLQSYKAINGTELNEKMPGSHKEFFKNLPWLIQHPDYLFVHSGIDPSDNFDSQITELKTMSVNCFKPKWLYWNELGYVSNEHQTNKTIISGHININNPIMFGNRVVIDTGAGYGGKLTALLLPEMTYLQS